jgi:hypothetical protein
LEKATNIRKRHFWARPLVCCSRFASTKTSIREEIAHLRGLDLKGLRSRWQSVFQRPPPDHSASAE